MPSLQSVAQEPVIAAGSAGTAVLVWRTAQGIQAAAWTQSPPGEPSPPAPPVDVAAPNDTPGFQGGPSHAGRIAGAGLTVPLEPAWTVDTGRSSVGALLAGGRVFLRGGGDDRPVIAYDLATGTERWRRPIERYAVYDHLAYADGRVFVPGHETLALDAATGAELWRSPAAGEWPVVDDGRLVLAGNGSITALRASDGTRLWEQPTGSESGAVTTGLGRAFRPGSNSAIAFDLPTGAPVWRQSAGSTGSSGFPAAFDGAWMWVMGAGDPRAYDLRTGLVTTLLPPKGGAIALSAPLGYQAREDTFVAFDLRTLEIRWTFPLGYEPSVTAPLVVDDLVYFASGGQVRALDRATGALRWSAPLSAPEDAGGGLAAGQGHLVVPTVHGADVFRTPGGPPPTSGGPGDGGTPTTPGDSGAGGTPPASEDPGDAGTPATTSEPATLPATIDRSPVDTNTGGEQHAAATSPPASTPPSTAAPRVRPPLRGSARLSGLRLVVTVSSAAHVTGQVTISTGRRTLTRTLTNGATRVTVKLKAHERPRTITIRYRGDGQHLPATYVAKVRR